MGWRGCWRTENTTERPRISGGGDDEGDDDSDDDGEDHDLYIIGAVCHEK